MTEPAPVPAGVPAPADEAAKAPRSTDVPVLRMLPWSSALARTHAGTKLTSLAVLSTLLLIRPTWAVTGFVALVVALGLVAGRVPWSAFPRFPRVFWIALAMTGVFASLSGTEGTLNWLRATAVTALLLVSALLIGWTTSTADVSHALDRILSPLRRIRFPVDEVHTSTVLAIRCFPLLVDELRTLIAAWRNRRGSAEHRQRNALHLLAEGHDLLVTALASTVRRGRDLAVAMSVRGGMAHVVREPLRLNANDLALIALTVAVVVAGLWI